MMRLVPDASVLAKLYFQEEHSAQCEHVIAAAAELVAPDLVWAELANIIWKRVGRKAIDHAEADDILAACLMLPIRILPTRGIAADALRLANTTGRSVYDCLYLVVAIQEGCLLLTADRRLVNGLRSTPWASHVRWVGEV
ncbi:MAG: type II toxin-antitoxin system VapC family toxin [Planctomycetaceae bacterium]|nr:type II toxin-antitoxin system VapC family toxin [Planctomycetaceae bacterium]